MMTTTTATHKLIRVAAAVAPAAALAATCGHMSWSDENLKQDIRPATDSLNRLRSFKSQALRIAAVVAPATALAATAGSLGWSDETLKRQIEPVAGALGLINQL